MKDLTSWGFGLRFEPQTIPQKLLVLHLGPYQFFLDLGKPSIAYDTRTELMLTFVNYQRLAARTLMPGCSPRYSDLELRLQWNALGLAGEGGEVADLIEKLHCCCKIDKEAIKEELGDILWYISAIATCLDMDLSVISCQAQLQAMPVASVHQELLLVALRLTKKTGKIADLIKKQVCHQHGIDRHIIEKELGDVFLSVSVIATKLGLTLDDIAATNIEKLRKRYPDGFSSEASKNRKD